MNTTTDWIGRRVSSLLPSKGKAASAPPTSTPAGASPAPTPGRGKPAPRSTRERLAATLRQGDEAMSPRMLRRTLEELRAIIDPRVSEVEGGRRAEAMAQLYLGATPERRHGPTRPPPRCSPRSATRGAYWITRAHSTHRDGHSSRCT